MIGWTRPGGPSNSFKLSSTGGLLKSIGANWCDDERKSDATQACMTIASANLK